MGVFRGARGSGRSGHGWAWFLCSFVIGLSCLLLFGQGVGASTGLRPMRFHAMVVSGDLVGSAFALSERVAVTNGHVVEGRRPGDTVRLVASAGSDRRADARILAISRHMDLAVLSIPAGFLPPVPTEPVRSHGGLAVVAVGVDASGGPRAGARLELFGHVTEPRKDIDVFGPGLVALVPGVRPGFSGGPILDRSDHLVGMLTAIRRGTAAARVVQAGAGSAYASQGASAIADEAFVIRAHELRAEVARLLAASGYAVR